MEIVPEISAEVVQDLEFGTFVNNSGKQLIELGSPSMGIFEIRGLNRQPVIITLNAPGQLTYTDPSVDESIPFSLQAAYSNNERNDPTNATPIDGNSAWFLISRQSGENGSILRQASAFVYIYGSITIGDVREGNYTGDLVLNVEYQ